MQYGNKKGTLIKQSACGVFSEYLFMFSAVNND